MNLFEERLERFEIPKYHTINLSSYSLFNIDNDDVFMSVCKESYEEDGVIVRLFNPTNEAKEVSINSEYIKDIKITNLYERELDTLDSNVQIKAKGYITLKLLGEDIMNKTILLQDIEQRLKNIYKEKYKPKFFEMMKSTIEKFEDKDFDKVDAISEKNVYLITYGDSIYEEGIPTIHTLKKFLNNKVGYTITDVHILPMFEYTSDDGFSVVDYMKIDKNLGNWESIKICLRITD